MCFLLVLRVSRRALEFDDVAFRVAQVDRRAFTLGAIA